MKKSIALAAAFGCLMPVQAAVAQDYERILPNGFYLGARTDITVRDAASFWSGCDGTPDQWLTRLENAGFVDGSGVSYRRDDANDRVVSDEITIDVYRFESDSGPRDFADYDHEYCMIQPPTAAELGFELFTDVQMSLDMSDELEDDSYLFASGMVDSAILGLTNVEVAIIAWRDGRNYFNVVVTQAVPFSGSIFFRDVENLALSIQQNTPR